MGVLYDYFAAASDEHAAYALKRRSGPATHGRSGLLRRTIEPPFDTVQTKWIEPVTVLGQLEAMLTGVSWEDEILPRDRSLGDGKLKTEKGDSGLMAVADQTRDALADVDDTRLPELTRRWSTLGTFGGRADLADLEDVLRDLVSLSRRARERGDRLYCWWSL